MASRTLTASQGNAAKPGGRARRPCLRQTPLVELYSGEPALTRDAGCRSASLVWTCAQLHYLTKRQQRNVDNETRLIKRSAMNMWRCAKQPKRSGRSAWRSWQRYAALRRALSSNALRQLYRDSLCHANGMVYCGAEQCLTFNSQTGVGLGPYKHEK